MKIAYLLRKSLPASIVGVFLLFSQLIFGQGFNTEFGQNRVQYHDFTWSFYQSDNFITYFSLGGQDLGRFSVQLAERELKSIEDVLDYKIHSRIEILVFNDISDLNQSNIGTGLELHNTGGMTKIIGNKIFVYFNGDHTDLAHQVRQGIANVLINNMIFGGSIQEVLQNAVLLNLPEWFVQGLVSYVGEEWNAHLDNRLRDGILSGKYKKFNKLSGEDARFAGHSFWYYVAENYGRDAIPNLLYLTRINRSLENGFLFVLGFSYNEAIVEWYNYFHKRYSQEESIASMPDDSLKIEKKDWKNRHYNRLKLSPSGDQVAFATNEMGKVVIYLQDLESGKRTKIFKFGFKTQTLETDYNYPIVEWDPTGKTLLVIYEIKDEIRILTYNVEENTKEHDEIVKFQRVLGASFMNHPHRLVLSAVNRGQSDIYTYDLRSTTVKQITNDFYDDLEPAYADFGDRKGIVFISNRTNDTLKQLKLDSVLPTGQFDAYFYNELKEDKKVLVNLTNTPLVNESMPVQIDSGHFAFLSPLNGIENRYAGYIDSTFSHFRNTIYFQDSIVEMDDGNLDSVVRANLAIVDSFDRTEVFKDTAYYWPITNMMRNIAEHHVQPRAGAIVDLVYFNGRYEFYKHDIPEISQATASQLENTTYLNSLAKETKVSEIKLEQETQERKSDYFFQSKYKDQDTTKGSTVLPTAETEDPVFMPTKVFPYRTKFSTEYVLTQLDKSIIINPYQSFVGNAPVEVNDFAGKPLAGMGGSINPDLSGLITLGISDLFENYRFYGGFRVPTSFNGSEYFFTFEDRTKRIDKKLTYYRKSDFNVYDFRPDWFEDDISAKQRTNYFESQWNYPFDVLRSLRFTAGFRNYNISFLSTDTFGLFLPDYNEDWIQGKLEYVFDNTINVGLNILNGTRYKFYYLGMKQFDFSVDFGGENRSPGVGLELDKGMTHVFGTDIRHYQKVHRQIIWANRLSAATSFGSKRVIYYLGGVNNWLLPKFNNSTEINEDNNYAFQSLEPNLRGFQQNIRNGNSYVLFNSELRIPVFTYLINTPIRSELIRNFQLVAFGDIGTAWEGLSPFDQDNPFNTERFTNGPVTVTVQYFRNPVVGGYGFGARTMLFGYFVRGDVAWGIDSGETKSPIWYLSLNLDF